MIKSLFLIGAGGHAQSCIDVIEQEGQYQIVGLVGMQNQLGQKLFGHPILATDKEIQLLAKKYKYALIGVGQIKTAETRIKLFEKIKLANCSLPTVISPRAYVSPHAKLGEGTIVMHGAIINAGAIVGRNCIINSQALLEHGVIVGDHCHISTSSVVNGGVKIGRGTFLGSGSQIRESVTIGENCLIGMGQFVLFDCANGTCVPLHKVVQ